MPSSAAICETLASFIPSLYRALPRAVNPAGKTKDLDALVVDQAAGDDAMHFEYRPEPLLR